MVWVVALVVPLLLATRAMLAPDPSLARRHTLMSLPIVALLGAIIVSAALRMRLYVHYYGLTTERLYTLVFMGWLAIVLALLATTVLRGRGRAFVGGSVISGARAPDRAARRRARRRGGAREPRSRRSRPTRRLRSTSPISPASAATPCRSPWRATLATPATGAARLGRRRRTLRRRVASAESVGPRVAHGRATAESGRVAHVERRRTARDTRRRCALGGASPRASMRRALAAGRRAPTSAAANGED